jgi:hypothetical protein
MEEEERTEKRQKNWRDSASFIPTCTVRGSPLNKQKGWSSMSSTENGNQQGRKAELPGQQLTGEQATAFEQVLRFQSDIEGQGRRVALTLDPIAEALANEGYISREMMSHVKAQLLRAHLYLDDLNQLLDSID